ncbi:uncharacterized protein LOC131151494 [Malania oleifera]|uniref:uncharacterized protein LOC131151494 n=1 Tax=Malania oleifera TaxID=397392 RepID=UPI0025ADB9B0|nr:uncharacterized protein LOC131151494 [Malania oleifera]
MSSDKTPVYYEFELEIPDEFPDGDWEAYRNLINHIREVLAVRRVHSIPMLANEEDRPSTWIDIKLRTSDDYAVWFRTRADNLYLVGYRLHDQQQWFEFSDENEKPQDLIGGSKSLGHSGSYDALMGRRAGNWEWEHVNVGLFSLRQAVESLQYANRQQRARSLQLVIMMINEAIRLNDIRDFFTVHTEENVFPSEFINQMRGWGNVSARVRNLEENADPNMELIIPENSMGLRTILQAIALLGIIKDCHVRHLRGNRMLLSSIAYRSTTPQGQQLVELFSVTLNGTSGEIYLYGTITVTDGLLSQYIYNRNRNNPEAIYANDTLLLSGPPRSISALDSFTIDVDLLASNEEISYGQGSWNVYLTATNEYDKPLSTDIEGRNGSVRLSYIVFSNAVQATVEVTLVNADGKNTADVFGIITARSDKVSNESMLFWKTSNENNLQVSLNRPVSLLRSAVAVPLDSSLRIRAQLFDRDRESNSNKEIAHDTVAFPPYLSGTHTRNISGRHGQVQVKVTWKNI